MKPCFKLNRHFQSPRWMRAAWMAVVCCTVSCGASTARAFTAEDADAIFDAHTKVFYRSEDGRAWHAKTTEGGKADFWMQAEMLEMVLDAYERTKNPEHLAMFTSLFRGFLANHGRTWERNKFNDDIMWMVIACARAQSVAILTLDNGLKTAAQTAGLIVLETLP